MSKAIRVSDFLSLQHKYPVIDVRSPAEFEKAHIPGAFNIPIFNNDERAEVGKRYKDNGKEEAVLLGLDIVGPKMKAFVLQAKKLAANNKVLMHCWRGGMRSAAMAWLFETAGLSATTLEGGYKAYRNYIHKELAQKAKMIILSGSTGSGKTDILLALKAKGHQVIDLEGLAHHKGSAFGSIGEKDQLQNEQFENNLHLEWSKIDKSKPVWIEDEGANIGRNYIPRDFFLNMRQAPIIKINLSKKVRIERLVKEYTHVDKAILIKYLDKIKKRLGPAETKAAIQSVNDNNYRVAVNNSLTYYDKAYAHGLTKRTAPDIYELDIEKDIPEDNADHIIDYFKTLNLYND
ncbi:MAG: tRNA 2-selenouridine(34) synthase MnmH [Bacteroidota bacterium]|nr:tRNA 2-selenouridine(34) synthase MnmH [Bacteroidota bacterium]